MNKSDDTSLGFDGWWARNHPADWWRKDLGAPVAHGVRLLAMLLARHAYEAGYMAALLDVQDAEVHSQYPHGEKT